MKTKLFITTMAFMAFTAMSVAQNPASVQKSQPQQGKGMAYVDSNNNGICDNRENGTQNAQAGKRNQDCPYRGQGMGQGKGQGMGPCGQGKGIGKNQNGPNFVDENKNGICDNSEKTEKK